MADAGAGSDPADELLEELARFTEREADDLARLATELQQLGVSDEEPGFDIEAIWASVERHIEFDAGESPEDGGVENG